jgi:putative membrane protein
MKTTSQIVLSALLAAACTFTSCKNENTTNNEPDQKKVSEEHNDAKFETRTEEKDAQFLVDAATINMEEVKLGQIAATNARLKEVKDLAAMMVEEHQKAYDQVSALAAKKQVTIPTAMPDKQKEEADKLSGKMGKDFDKDYCDKMVDGHKDAITKFEKASTDAADADIRNWATEMLPALRKHLDHAMACRDKCDKVYK